MNVSGSCYVGSCEGAQGHAFRQVRSGRAV